jgi:hypothetical protein
MSVGTAMDIGTFYSRLPQPSLRNPDAADGVAVHVDGPAVDGGTAYGDWGGGNCVPRKADGTCPGHGDTYGSHMAGNRRAVFHYAILPGGNGTLNGRSFDCANDGRSCTHELGHNLNLNHFGAADGPPLLGVKTRADDTVNCKPAYLSGINYAWYPGGDPSNPNFYFSRGQFAGLPFLKSNLDELAGIGITVTPTFLTCAPGSPFCFDRSGFMIDWNRDGVYRTSVAAPINAGRASCAAFSRGSGHLADGVDSTPAVAALGGTYYVFYVKGSRLYYRREARRGAFPSNSRVGDGNERSEQITGPEAWTWSSEAEITGLYVGVTQMDAEEYEDLAGNRVVVLVYRNLAGSLAWLTVSPSTAVPGSDIVTHRGRLRVDDRNFATAEANGLDLEPYGNQLWLAYYRAGTLRLLRLNDDLTWEDEDTVRDELGAPLRPSPVGVALAAGRDADMLLVAGTPDPADPDAALLEARRWNWVTDLWELQASRFETDVRTTSDPALAFVDRPTSEHVLGGWYMLAFRGERWVAGDPLSRRPPDVRLTDARGRFSLAGVDWWTAWQDEWTPLPDSAHNAVALGVSPYEPGRVMGAFVWGAPRDWPVGVFHDRSLGFLPYADGTSPTTANDQDDARAIRFGLCYSLRERSPDCNPPLRIMRWTPTPSIAIHCPGGGSP